MANKNGTKNGVHNISGGGDSDFEPDAFDMIVGNKSSKNPNGNSAPPKKKKLSVERIYQKKTQLEHILLRPDTYIGSVEPVTQPMWVYDGEDEGMVFRDITFVPGLYKIFDEIIVNAADHKQRDKKMDTIKVDIEPENNKISIYNNGKGIDIAMHKVENVYVPTLIFGHLLTGANFDDDEKKVVGGRNGYGAKLCNIFSNKFIIETSSKSDKKSFKQTWQDNMSKAGEAIIKENKSEDFTKITFYPDLSKFNMTELDKDIVALMSRRAYDIAGSSKGVKVILNGKRLPIKGFKDYVDTYLKDKEDEQGNPLKSAYEATNDRWEIAVAMSEKGFQQVSFVNSIATTKGGRHVDHVTDLVVAKLADVIKKKNKAGVNVKPFQLKNHLWVFVNCLIENPAFDSQTKESLNTQLKSFGSKCTPSEKFFVAALKTGIVESVLNWVKFKADTMLANKCSKTKQNKVKGIPKLEDANDAGTKNSIDCTLILTEGDSAKSLVVAGLGVIGRDKYGVFPLRGKMLNVREATSKQISENAEITALLKIMGLQYRKKYESMEDLKSLRYGRLMIMTDQDQDGSHIKGLLINFIHHNWPSLLKLNFLEEFITPIVKVSKGSQSLSFYSLPEFEEWKKGTDNWFAWKVKYYKGLGTSTSQEAKEYFSDLARHRIRFKYDGPEDDKMINLAFSKKMIDSRKEWLTDSLERKKMRRELGLPEVYLYGKDTKTVTYQDFVNKELILFSNLDNERSIPSLMDGLKPGQRKVLFTCFKRNDKREVKVAQLAGSVGEHSAYHHGEQSLMQTIIGLAQNFVGSNNINLLQPLGQFGTRLQGGKDHASARYIFTMLSPLARKLFPVLDDPLLNHLYDDNLKVEPEYYVPIIPMVLVNGAEGIGTGWSTKVPNYNPRDIVKNIKRKIEGQEIKPMKPWFKGFRGEIHQVEAARYVVSGEMAELESNKIEITELPIRTWTQSYKEQVLEVMSTGTEKTPQFITDYKEYHTDATVRFVVTMPENNLRKAESEGLHKAMKLQTTFTTTSMVLFDSKGCLRRYESAEEILDEFYQVRLDHYNKRKTYLLGMLEAESEKLKNQARFIQEKIDGDIKIENKKRKVFMQTLEERGYKSDPVKKWRRANNIEPEKKKRSDDDEEEGERSDEEEKVEKFDKDYDYLMDMPMKSMLLEKKEELLKKRDTKLNELRELEDTSIEDLWRRDLDAFMVELEKIEELEQEAIAQGITQAVKFGSKMPVKGKNKAQTKQAIDCKPAPFGRRIATKVDFDAYSKKELKKLDKAKKEPKEGKTEKSPKSSPKKKVPKRKKSGSDIESDDSEKRLTLKKKHNFSDSDLSEVDDNFEVEPREMPVRGGQRKTFNFDDSEDEEDEKSSEVIKSSSGPSRNISDDDSDFDDVLDKKKRKGSASDDDFEMSPKKKQVKKEPKKKDIFVKKAEKKFEPVKRKNNFGFSGSEDEGDLVSSKNNVDEDITEVVDDSKIMSEDELTRSLAPKPAISAAAKKSYDSDGSDDADAKKKKSYDSDDSDFVVEKLDKKAPAKKKTQGIPKKKAPAKKKKDSDDSASDFEDDKPAKKKALAKKKKGGNDSGSDFEAEKVVKKKAAIKKKKNDRDSGSDFEAEKPKKSVPAKKKKKDNNSDSDFDEDKVKKFAKESSNEEKTKAVVSSFCKKHELISSCVQEKPKTTFSFGSSSEDEDHNVPLSERITSPNALGATTGRSRKPVSYNFGGDSDSN